MNIRTIQTIEEFKALRPAWNRLVDTLDQSEPFYCWEWANAHIEHRCSNTDELLIIVIEHGKELLAIAPLCIQRERLGPFTGRVLRTLTGDHADYGSFYLHPERNQGLLLRMIFRTLFEQRHRWDALHLLNFNSRNPQTFLIGEVVQAEFGISCDLGERILTPFIRFGKGDERLGQRHPRSIDRRERNLLKNYDVEMTIDGPFSEKLWDRLIELHLAKWPTSVFRCPRNRAFFRQIIRDLSPEHKTSFSWITIDGKIAAIDFGFQTGNRVLAYMHAYDPKYNKYGLGGLMLKNLLAHHASSKDEFDFLRGNEAYKFEWTDLVAANHNLLIHNGFLKGRLLRAYIRLKDRLRRIHWLVAIRRRLAPAISPPAPESRPERAVQPTTESESLCALR